MRIDFRGEGPDFPKVFAFSTFFYPKLIDGGHASVKRWSKKVILRDILISFNTHSKLGDNEMPSLLRLTYFLAL